MSLKPSDLTIGGLWGEHHKILHRHSQQGDIEMVHKIVDVSSIGKRENEKTLFENDLTPNCL